MSVCFSAQCLMDSEPQWRLAVALSAFVGFALLEVVLPMRPREQVRRQRWPANLALLIVNGLMLRLLFPLAATGVAIWAQQRGYGALPQLALPSPLPVVLGLIILDVAIYWQHRLFHRWPIFWRLHAVHHADIAVDISTGGRFHPAEILLSMLIKCSLIVTLGIDPLAVLLFELLLNACSSFNHSNIRIPAALERRLRRLLITPELHRIHHSQRVDETNSNFGFSVPLWDKLFGSYKDSALMSQSTMPLGLEDFRAVSLKSVLLMPWRYRK